MAIAVDLSLLVVLLLSLGAGLKDGFMESLFSIASWIGGVLIAIYFPRLILGSLPAGIRNFPGIAILIGVVFFLAAFFVIRIVGMAVTGNGKSHPGPLDRLLGMILGVGRGLLLAGIIASFLVAYLPPNGSVVRQSHSLPILLPVGRVVAAVAPERIRSKMDEGWNRLEKGAPEVHKGPVTI
jgi:uncharacterized membrane protein required for colicin V production